MKKPVKIIILIIPVLVFLGFLTWKYTILQEKEIICNLDVKICPDGRYVPRILPDCDFALCPGEKEGILISLPQANKKLENPVLISGKAKGFWFFEAEFNAELFDNNRNSLGMAILTAESDWMTEDFVNFKGEIFFEEPETSSGTLKFLNSNPSGLQEHQKSFEMPVRF